VPASTPANAGRSACAICAMLTPIWPATPRSICTRSSGFWPRDDSPTSARPAPSHALASLLGQLIEDGVVRTRELQLHLLLIAAEAGRERVRRDAADELNSLRSCCASSS
jgi:hypothetical protein